MSSASPARACMSASIASLSFVVARFSQFHRLHSEQGQMINATAINAVPVLEEVYAGTTQEWSLRLDLTQHGETHEVLTHRFTDSQLFLASTGGAAWPFSVGRVVCLVSSVSKD